MIVVEPLANRCGSSSMSSEYVLQKAADVRVSALLRYESGAIASIASGSDAFRRGILYYREHAVYLRYLIH